MKRIRCENGACYLKRNIKIENKIAAGCHCIVTVKLLFLNVEFTLLTVERVNSRSASRLLPFFLIKESDSIATQRPFELYWFYLFRQTINRNELKIYF